MCVTVVGIQIFVTALMVDISTRTNVKLYVPPS